MGIVIAFAGVYVITSLCLDRFQAARNEIYHRFILQIEYDVMNPPTSYLLLRKQILEKKGVKKIFFCLENNISCFFFIMDGYSLVTSFWFVCLILE